MTSEIRAAIARHAKLPVDIASLRDEDDLFAAGMASLSSVNLMLALEDHFDVEFPNEMLNRATFSSVSSIAAAITGLTTSAA